MRSVLLCLLTPLLTFSLGVGFDRVISSPPMQVAPVSCPQVTPVFVPLSKKARIEMPIPPVPTTTLILDNPTKIMGDMGFGIIGPKPRGFPYFDVIELTLSGAGLPDSVSVYESTSDTIYQYDANFALITNRKLFFVTSQTDSGFEYRFDGEFVRTDFEKISNKNKVALRGTLTKTKDGQTVAESFVNLDMGYMSCN